MDHTLEYWKKRCELAEKVIEIWEPYHTANNAWTLWMNFQSSGDIAVILPRPDKVGEDLSESFKEKMDNINVIEPETLEEISKDMNEFLVEFQEKAKSMRKWANEVSERYSKFNKGTKWQD